jgi:hypothetical protein
MIKVRIHADDHLTFALLNSVENRKSESVVFHAFDDPHMKLLMFLTETTNQISGPIRTMIINYENFECFFLRFEDFGDPLDKRGDVRAFVVRWKNDRYINHIEMKILYNDSMMPAI